MKSPTAALYYALRTYSITCGSRQKNGGSFSLCTSPFLHLDEGHGGLYRVFQIEQINKVAETPSFGDEECSRENEIFSVIYRDSLHEMCKLSTSRVETTPFRDWKTLHSANILQTCATPRGPNLEAKRENSHMRKRNLTPQGVLRKILLLNSGAMAMGFGRSTTQTASRSPAPAQLRPWWVDWPALARCTPAPASTPAPLRSQETA